MFPGARIVVKDQLISSYGTMFGFRNGLLITISISCLLAFFILAYDRAAGLPREEQMEIAILKALGWETRDVIRVNMLQSVVISLTAFLMGIVGAYVYVYYFGAPGLRLALTGWSAIYPSHPLTPSVNITEMISLLFLTVIPYIAVGIVPVWRSCIIDPEVVFRK
jgi:ABC-type lipoprotein release transport system permease subunit